MNKKGKQTDDDDFVDISSTPLNGGKHPAMGGGLPSRERYRKMVSDLLRAARMNPRHPDYKFFRALLTNVCDAADRRNRTMRGIGTQLLELTENPTPESIASIRKMASGLMSFYVSPDFSAVRGVLIAMQARVKRNRSNNNLRTPDDSVSDKQIRAVLREYETRAEQAKKLGITERQLFRRLKKINDG